MISYDHPYVHLPLFENKIEKEKKKFLDIINQTTGILQCINKNNLMEMERKKIFFYQRYIIMQCSL